MKDEETGTHDEEETFSHNSEEIKAVPQKPAAVPLFLSAKHEPLLLPGNQVSDERLRRARRLKKIEDLLASHKRNKRIVIAFLTVVLVILFVTELTYSLDKQKDWQLTLLKSIKGVMALAYGVIFIAFAPLFLLFVRLLKSNFIEMYYDMKVKLYVSFVAFMAVMGFRFTVYVLL